MQMQGPVLQLKRPPSRLSPCHCLGVTLDSSVSNQILSREPIYKLRFAAASQLSYV